MLVHRATHDLRDCGLIVGTPSAIVDQGGRAAGGVENKHPAYRAAKMRLRRAWIAQVRANAAVQVNTIAAPDAMLK